MAGFSRPPVAFRGVDELALPLGARGRESKLSAELRANRGDRSHQREPVGRRRLDSVQAVEVGCVVVYCVDEDGSDSDLVRGGEGPSERVAEQVAAEPAP
jgi:hypothetical protein